MATLLHRGFSLSVGGYHYETDGFHENNDVNHDVADAVATLSVTPALDLFGEYRHRETDAGDRRVPFDLDELSDTIRVDFERDVYRLGFTRCLLPTRMSSDWPPTAHWILAAQKSCSRSRRPPIRARTIKEGQLQYIGQFGPHTLQIGGSVSHVDGDEESGILSPFGNFFEITPIDALQANAYGYAILRIRAPSRGRSDWVSISSMSRMPMTTPECIQNWACAGT